MTNLRGKWDDKVGNLVGLSGLTVSNIGSTKRREDKNRRGGKNKALLIESLLARFLSFRLSNRNDHAFRLTQMPFGSSQVVIGEFWILIPNTLRRVSNISCHIIH